MFYISGMINFKYLYFKVAFVENFYTCVWDSSIFIVLFLKFNDKLAS